LDHIYLFICTYYATTTLYTLNLSDISSKFRTLATFFLAFDLQAILYMWCAGMFMIYLCPTF